MQGAVGIDEVDVSDFAAQAGEKFQRAARQRLLLASLARSHRRDHVGVCCVIRTLKFGSATSATIWRISEGLLKAHSGSNSHKTRMPRAAALRAAS